MRRNRRTAWSRALVRENTLTAHDLIWPVFVIEGQNRTEAVASNSGHGDLLFIHESDNVIRDFLFSY